MIGRPDGPCKQLRQIGRQQAGNRRADWLQNDRRCRHMIHTAPSGVKPVMEHSTDHRMDMMSRTQTSVSAASARPARSPRANAVAHSFPSALALALPLALALALAILAAFSSPARAEENRFSNTEIQTLIIGKRIYLAAPMGGEFPLNYRRSGVVDGSGEAVGLGRLAKPDDTGKWWIKDDRLCQQFTTWYKGAPMCFELYKTGATTLKWIRDNGQTGTARIGETI